jgi:hypothetical protein
MTKFLLALSLSLSACAARPAQVSAPSVAVEPLQVDVPSRERFSPIDPELPTAGGRRASADLWLCVSGLGEVVDAKVTRRSGAPSFDRALVEDARGWKFPMRTGGGAAPECARLRVHSHPVAAR